MLNHLCKLISWDRFKYLFIFSLLFFIFTLNLRSFMRYKYHYEATDTFSFPASLYVLFLFVGFQLHCAFPVQEDLDSLSSKFIIHHHYCQMHYPNYDFVAHQIDHYHHGHENGYAHFLNLYLYFHLQSVPL